MTSIPPALTSFRYNSLQHRRFDLISIKNFISKFVDESSLFRIDREIQRELYILGKILYKMNGPFRRHGHFQLAKRLRKLLIDCYDETDRGNCGFIRTTNAIFRRFIDSVRLDEKDELYFPSGEYFLFVLESLRNLASRFVRIVDVCVEFCSRTMHMLNFGHFVQVHCLLLGVVARFRSDACDRLRESRRFFVDYERRGFVEIARNLRRVDQGSMVEIRMENNADIDRILDESDRVAGENLASDVRKRAVDYFENLFNVRLVAQLEKRKRMSGKERKHAAKDLDFRQALGSIKSSSKDAGDGLDLGVPIARTIKMDDSSDIPDGLPDASDHLDSTADDHDDLAAQLDRVKSIKALRRFARKLETSEDPRFTPAVRFIDEELGKMEKLKANGTKEVDGDPDGRKKLAKRFGRTRIRLRRMLENV